MRFTPKVRSGLGKRANASTVGQSFLSASSHPTYKVCRCWCASACSLSARIVSLTGAGSPAAVGRGLGLEGRARGSQAQHGVHPVRCPGTRLGRVHPFCAVHTSSNPALHGAEVDPCPRHARHTNLVLADLSLNRDQCADTTTDPPCCRFPCSNRASLRATASSPWVSEPPFLFLTALI